MKSTIYRHVIPFLTLFIIIAPVAIASEPLVEKIINDSQRQQLCGKFVAGSGIYKKFVFGDKNSVNIHASGLEFSTTYFILENIVFIKTDKGPLKLLVESPTLLTGKDTWTKGNSYSRENAPEKSCLPYALSSSEQTEMTHQICQMAAIALQKKGKLKEAAEKYLQCCNSGDYVSCNKYGLLKAMLWNDQKTALRYYEKACSMGYGGGCSNLATYEKRKGNLKKAKKLFEKACSMGFKSACFEAALME
jgi:TPR repeat protein